MKRIYYFISIFIMNIGLLLLVPKGVNAETHPLDTEKQQDIEEQINILSETHSTWDLFKDQDFVSMGCYWYEFAVTDIDGNGRLDLFLHTEFGSGSYSCIKLYEVDKEHDTLELRYNNFPRGALNDFAPDIGDDQFDAYAFEGRRILMFQDYNREGWEHNQLKLNPFSLQNGEVRTAEIGKSDTHVSMDANNNQQSDTKYYDAKGKSITKEDFKNLPITVYPDAEKGKMTFKWINSNDIDTSGKLTENLKKSWKGFSCTLPDGTITATLDQNMFLFEENKEIKPEPKVICFGKDLKKDIDYSLEYKNFNKTGEATIIVTGIGNYDGKVEIPYYLIDIKLEKENYLYSGKVILPELIISCSKDVLKADEDYTVNSSSVNVGNAEATIIGKGKYKGSLSVKYQIVTVEINIEDIGVMFNDQEFSINVDIASTSKTVPTESNLKWNIDDPNIEWGEVSVVSTYDNHYIVKRTAAIHDLGEYSLSVEFDGEVGKTDIHIVKPEYKVEYGPVFEDGSLVYENGYTITSFADIRFIVSSDVPAEKAINGFLQNVTYNQEYLEKYVNIISQNTDISDDKKNGRYIIRVKPFLNYENKIKFSFSVKNKQTLEEKIAVRNGKYTDINFRSDGKKGTSYGKKWGLTWGPGKNVEHSFYFADSMFYEGATKFNHPLALMTLGLELSSYSSAKYDDDYNKSLKQICRAENVCNTYQALSFENMELRNYQWPLSKSDDKVAFSIAKKYISSEKSDDTLVAVVIRGGGYGAEWASNFKVGNEGDSYGFNKASEEVYKTLAEYIQDLSNKKKIIGNLKLWITGYSRGGAVANILAHKINNKSDFAGVKINNSDKYVYTFATPAGQRGDNHQDDNIFNIVSENDLVPKIPTKKWGFSRYGRDVILPEETPEAVEKSFYNFTGKPLDAKNEKELENWLINLFMDLAPDTKTYVDKIQDNIFKECEKQYESLKGSFVMGLIYGLIKTYGLDVITDYFMAFSSSSVSDQTKLPSQELMHLPGLYKAINKKDVDFDKFENVHYPEHYLAWLESGGIKEISNSQFYAYHLDSKSKRNVAKEIAKYVDQKEKELTYKTVQINGNADISVVDENGICVSNVVAGEVMEPSKAQLESGDYLSTVASEDATILVIPTDCNYSVNILGASTGKIQYSISEYAGSEGIVRFIGYDDILLDSEEDISFTVSDTILDDINKYNAIVEGNRIEPSYVADFDHSESVNCKFKGHTWSDWDITAEPSASLEGSAERICQICGEKSTTKIHELSKSSVPAGNRILDLESNAYYEFADDGTLIYLSPKNKVSYNMTIPNMVKIDDYTYKVTTITSKAFEDVEAWSVTIGENIKTIDKKAFADSDVFQIRFMGDTPTFSKNCFKHLYADIYYPPSWKNIPEEKLTGGDINWISLDSNKDLEEIIYAINIREDSLKIAAGKKVRANLRVWPRTALMQNIKWSSSDESVATVNQDGLISINKKAGGKSVTIYAETTDGSSKRDSLKIKVMKGSVKKITIKGKSVVKAGKSLKLKAKVKASKRANKKLKWESDNSRWAVVSKSGRVKALAAGKGKTVTITASSTDGSGKKAKKKIKIK